MHIWVTFLALVFGQPTFNHTRTIFLKEQYPKFEQRRLGMSMAEDGSFVLQELNRITHWDAHGQFILDFTLESEERTGIGDVYFDVSNRQYWVTEGFTRRTWVFNNQGELLGKTLPLGSDAPGEIGIVRQFVQAGSRLFGVRWEDFDFWETPNPAVLVELNLAQNPNRDQWRMKLSSKPFFELSETQRMFRFNWKFHFAVLDGETLFVTNELTPTIYTYRTKGSSTNRHYKKEPLEHTLALPHYQRPRLKADDVKDRNDFLMWWHSWSRLNGFSAWGNAFLIAYEVPDPNDPQKSLQAVQIVSRQGNIAGPFMRIKGLFLGARNNEVFFLVNNERGQYAIHCYSVK